LFVPHERALLGRTICLSYLSDHRTAIDAASKLIEGSPPNAGDAYYWRAWNDRRLNELPQATADIERAKSLLYNESVLTLAGIIHHDSDRLDAATADLLAAKAANRAGRNCSAMWYLGLVEVKREEWLSSAAHFVDAATCYHREVLDTEKRLEDLLQSTILDTAFKTSQAAMLQTALRDDRAQESAAAYNAALQFFRGGDRSKAAVYLDMAARDPARAAQVAELREQLKQY